MKQYLIVAMTILFMSVGLNMNAQNAPTRKPTAPKHVSRTQKPQQKFSPEKMIEMRVKMMSNRLMLSDSEATKFEALYKSYLEDMQKVNKDGKTEQKPAPKAGEQKPTEHKTFSDADIDAHFKKNFEKRAKMVSLQESYYNKFRKILSAKQVRKIFEPAPTQNKNIQKHPTSPVPFHGQWQKSKRYGRQYGQHHFTPQNREAMRAMMKKMAEKKAAEKKAAEKK